MRLLLLVWAVTSCAAQPPAKPQTVLTEPPSGAAREPAPPAAPAKPQLRAVRYQLGDPPPPHGCFARSESRQSIACVVGHVEPDPDGVSTAVRFVGGFTESPLPLTRGVLDENTLVSLNRSMVAGDYRQLGDPEWTSSFVDPNAVGSSPSELFGEFRIILQSQRIRIEHDAKLVYELIEQNSLHLVPSCAGRAWAIHSGIVIERTCKVIDEGVEVLTIEVWECDSSRCT